MWLEEQEVGSVTHYCALDDWDLTDEETPPVSEESRAAACSIREHFVRTDPDVGLQERHRDEALRILR